MPDMDKYNLRIISAVLFVPLFIEAFTVFRHGPDSIFTGLVYMGVLTLSLFKIRGQIRGGDLCILVAIYAFITLNIILYPSTVEYYQTVVMCLSMIFYVPVGCFVVRHVKNWNNLFVEIKPFAVGSVFLGIYIVFFGDVGFGDEYFNYMEFSYSILPFVAALYVIARRERKLKILWFTLFFIGSLCMVIYGARASTLFLLLYIVFLEFYNGTSKSKIYILVFFLLVTVVIIIFFDNIILYLNGIDGLKDSRLIAKAVAGQLSDGGERDILIDDSIKRISSMDLDIPGIFGDRAYIRGIYPHNIILEILMQFGLFLGAGLLIFLLYVIYIDIKKTEFTLPSAYFCCVLFGRFFFSGSYIQDGSFWLWLFCMFSIFKYRHFGRINKPICKY